MELKSLIKPEISLRGGTAFTWKMLVFFSLRTRKSAGEVNRKVRYLFMSGLSVGGYEVGRKGK